MRFLLVGSLPSRLGWTPSLLVVDLNMLAQQPSIAPTLGTPTNRTSADNFTTTDMMSFQADVARWIRSEDFGAVVSTGHSMARRNAWHLRQSYYERERDWDDDTREEYLQTVRDQSKCCNLISMHVYPKGGSWRWNNVSVSVVDVVRFTSRMIMSTNQSVYVGEFGVSLPDRRNEQSIDYNFTQEIVVTVREEEQIALATYWVWEFPGQSSTWSIGPGLDEATIRVLQKKNTHAEE